MTDQAQQRLPEELAALAGGVDVTLVIVRHAETEYNVGHVMQGWSDSPITPLGREQIAAVGAALAGVHFDRIFSSDLPRTRTTAEGIVAARMAPLDVEFRQDLREWNFGGHEEVESQVVWGKLFAKHNLEVDREMTAIRTLAERMSWSDIFDGIADLDETGASEKAAASVLRADTALAEIITQTVNGARPGGARSALIVSHGGFITTLLRQLVPDVTVNTILPNCSITTVRIDGDAWRLDGHGVSADSYRG